MNSLALAFLLITSYRLEWRDLPQQTLGRRVALTTTDGVRLKGRVLAFEEDAMRLSITRTSDARRFPKGDRLVPRGAFTCIRVDKTKGHTWRAVGAAITGSIGGTAGVPILLIGASPGVGVGVIAVSVGIGYLLGWSADRKVIEIATE